MVVGYFSSLDLRNPADSDQWQHTKENIQKKKLAESDGYATALVVLALEESGACHRDPTLRRGLEWLNSISKAMVVGNHP